ncbi:MAG: hypothetical protein IJQ12_00490 [Lachnospiraceae bacterium]|nr:hypothetical protein [Lachnospiraceae bacterium]
MRLRHRIRHGAFDRSGHRRRHQHVRHLKSYINKGDGAGSDVSEDRERRSDVSDRNISYIDEKILSQLDADDYSEEAWDTIRFLVHCLDEKGFFPYEAKDIAEISGFSETLVEECLCDLRVLEPHGIFAFDIGI